jgi:hypothetical protein
LVQWRKVHQKVAWVKGRDQRGHLLIWCQK